MTGLPTLADMLTSATASARRAREEAERPPWPANPFPSGIRPGLASDRVLAALRAAHPSWLEFNELMANANCSRGAASWAIRFLTSNGLARAMPSLRHPNYHRYQAIIKGE